jgi:hypothetical protein
MEVTKLRTIINAKEIYPDKQGSSIEITELEIIIDVKDAHQK